MKAVVLAAGRGTRMRREDAAARLDPSQQRAAAAGAKGMMPIGGRPFLDYILSSLADAGLDEVCIVVPPGESPVRAHYDARRPRRVRLAFAVEPEPLGSADALAAAEAFAGSDDFIALNSDNFYPPSALERLRDLHGAGLPVFELETLLAKSNFTRERVEAFAVLSISASGHLQRIVEKPESAALAAAGPVYLSLNLFRFTPAIFEACREVPRSGRGEYELPQAVGWAILNRGQKFRTFRCDEGVLDLSARADVAAVAERLVGTTPRP